MSVVPSNTYPIPGILPSLEAAIVPVPRIGSTRRSSLRV